MDDWKSLPEREQAIIDHVARYRVTTVDVLHEKFFPELQSVKSVRKIAARMIADGWLDRFQAVSRRNLYVLGRNFEQPRAKQGTTACFSEQSLLTAVAILYFCVRHRHRRLTVPELLKVDKRLCQTGLNNSPYYVEQRENQLGLSLLLVDRDSPVRRLTWKVKRLVGQRKRHDGFHAWMLDQRFSITILTAFAEKQQQLIQAFSAHAEPLAKVRVALVPEFAPYLSQV